MNLYAEAVATNERSDGSYWTECLTPEPESVAEASFCCLCLAFDMGFAHVCLLPRRSAKVRSLAASDGNRFTARWIFFILGSRYSRTFSLSFIDFSCLDYFDLLVLEALHSASETLADRTLLGECYGRSCFHLGKPWSVLRLVNRLSLDQKMLYV